MAREMHSAANDPVCYRPVPGPVHAQPLLPPAQSRQGRPLRLRMAGLTLHIFCPADTRDSNSIFGSIANIKSPRATTNSRSRNEANDSILD